MARDRVDVSDNVAVEVTRPSLEVRIRNYAHELVRKQERLGHPIMRADVEAAMHEAVRMAKEDR